MIKVSTLAALSVTLAALAGAVGHAQEPTLPLPAWGSKAGLVNLEPRTKAIDASEVADRLAIQDAFTRWSIGLDEGRLDVLRDLFTNDADYTVITSRGEVVTKHVGPDAIAERIRTLQIRQADQRRHAISSITIEKLAGDTAEAVAYAVTVRSANGPSLLGSVLYTGSLKRGADGIWRFTRLNVGLDP